MMGRDKRQAPTSPRGHPRAPTLRHRQLGILGRIFKSGGLEIDIKNQHFSFDNVADFKQFLTGKTEIPASKVQEMLKRSDTHLAEEVKQLRKIEETINEKLAATIRDPKSIDSYLDDATMVRFSQDYDWRQIMFELSKKSTDYSEYKLEAVSSYMKYLRSRVEVAESIRSDRGHATPNTDSDSNPAMSETIDTKALTDNYEEYIRKDDDDDVKASDDPDNPLFVSTGMVDLSEYKEDSNKPGELERIPRGKTVKIDISKITELPMKIASRKFLILIGDEIELVSKGGDRYPLNMGENLVGRSTKCSAVLNPEMVDISRQHLVIEVYPDKTLHFTDLSSSGSMLPANLFKDSAGE